MYRLSFCKALPCLDTNMPPLHHIFKQQRVSIRQVSEHSDTVVNMLSSLDLLFCHSHAIQLMIWGARWQLTPRLKGCKCAISSKISLMSLISLISLTSSVQCWTFTSRCSPGSARRALNKNAHMHPAFPPFWASYVLMLAFVLHAHILPFNLSCGSVFRCVSWLVFWYVHITLPYNL